MLKPRHKKLLEELPKNGYKVGPAAIKAGYSPKTANDHPKEIMKAAMKAQAREIIEMVENPAMTTKEMKQSLAEIIGLSREDVFNRLKSIAYQDKDLSSALKVLAPLAKDLGVNLGVDEAPKTIVPILNIGIERTAPNSPASTVLIEDNREIENGVIDIDRHGGVGINHSLGGS